MSSRKLLPFWNWLALIIVVMGGLLIAHYLTQSTPRAIAFVVPMLDLPVYWYGIVVMGALMFATMAVAQLVQERSVRVFEQVISAEIRQQPIDAFGLPAQLTSDLQAQQITTVGQLLWLYGLNPKHLKLASDDLISVEERITSLQAEGVIPRSSEESLHDKLNSPQNDSFRNVRLFTIDDMTIAPWHKWNPDYVWGAVMWALVLGIIGARLYHVLTPQPSLGITPAYYFANPVAIFNLRNGGLGIFGAIAGGAVGLWLYVRRHALPLAEWLDLGALMGALAQAVGRWANYFNQELFGTPTELPWAIYIDPAFRPSGMADVVRYHPTFLYESVWSFGTFFLLYWLWRGERVKAGGVAAVYLICYGFGRILLETIRLDSNTTGGIATASLVSGGMIVIGVVGLLWKRGAQIAQIATDADK